MTKINNIFCVGRNYRLHAAELGNAVPERPMIFMKPSHAAFAMEGQALKLPSQFGSVHYEAELVVRVGRPYEPGIAVMELLDSFALGLDLTLRDAQEQLKKQQHPWLQAKGFRHSAPLTSFLPLPALLDELLQTSFSLDINGEQRQKGSLQEAIFDLSTLLTEIGTHYGLDEGDLVFTGTPSGVGSLQHNDQLQLYWNGGLLGECRVEL